jgi:hypothetical protein
VLAEASGEEVMAADDDLIPRPSTELHSPERQTTTNRVLDWVMAIILWLFMLPTVVQSLLVMLFRHPKQQPTSD